MNQNIDPWNIPFEGKCSCCKTKKLVTLEMVGPGTVQTCLECQKIAPSQRQFFKKKKN